jgi:hypothetical protein
MMMRLAKLVRTAAAAGDGHWALQQQSGKYLAGGQVVEVGTDAKVKVNVKVQKSTEPTD